MSVSKDKVLSALNLKLKGKNVSKKSVESYATRWAEKIADEDGIDDYIDDRIDDVIDAQKEADRQATQRYNEGRSEAAKAAAGEEKKEEEPQEDPNMPAWAKTLMQANQTMMAELNGFKQSQTAKTLEERFYNHEDVKGVPKPFLVGRVPTKEEDFEAAVAGVKETIVPELSKMGVKFGDDKPITGNVVNNGGGKVKQASDAELDAAMKNF